MKAIRVVDGAATLVDANAPAGHDVLIRVVSSSICGSDLHLIESGMVEGRILGHEFAGTTADGRAVAVEPAITCGSCSSCEAGERQHCHRGALILGILADGGLAEQVRVPEACLVPLPTGLDPTTAALTEPIGVGLRAVNRATIATGQRVLVIGAGPIGLAVVAVLGSRGVPVDVAARHPHQQAAAERLGASIDVSEGYDVVIDAAATESSFAQAILAARATGRIVLAGTPWEPLLIDHVMFMREVAVIPSMAYGSVAGRREIDEAARILADDPAIAATLITHRFPLDAAAEGFAAAADRAGGAIKVVFDV